MKRTQIQLPDPLYERVKEVAKLQDWSVAEVIRRGAEYMVYCYSPESKEQTRAWKPPPAQKMGPFKAPVEEWRELAQEL